MSETGSPWLSERRFVRQLRTLLLLAWTVPPVFGLSFLLFIRMFTPEQVRVILSTPLEPAFILGSLVLAVGYLDRHARPIRAFLAQREPAAAERAIACVRGFPLAFWSVFLLYLLAAPSSVIVSAELYAGFQAQPVDWFRIHLVALIVSIIVGLPIFFLMFDLFGRALAGVALRRPLLSVGTRVFLIGSLVPLLMATMLVQYYWTRTGYFTGETLAIWLALQLLAIAGSLMFVRSFGQGLAPLQRVIAEGLTAGARDLAAIRPRSTDEIGVLASDFQLLVQKLRESERNLSAITESANDGILVHVDGRIVYANRRLAEMTDYGVDELRQMAVTDLVAVEHRAAIRERIEARLRGGDVPAQYESVMRRRDGQPVPIELTAALTVWQGAPAVTVIARDVSARRRAEEALRQSEMLFNLAFHATPAMYSISRVSEDLQDDMFIAVNDAFVRASGYRREEVVGRSSRELGLWVTEQDREQLLEELAEQGSVRDQVLRFRTRSGEVRQVLGNISAVRLDNEPCVLIVSHDITERQQAEEALAREKERAQVTLASIADGVITTDVRGHIDYLNPVAESLTGWTLAEARGLALTEVFRLANEHTGRLIDDPLMRGLPGGTMGDLAEPAVLLRRDGHEFPVETSASPIGERDGRGLGAVIVFRDVSQERAVAQQMLHQATHDALTGLINRLEFEHRLTQALGGVRNGREHAVCYLDLDQFKIVNDTCGHMAGDELLRQIAERLHLRVRVTDTLARLGGDEFGVLLLDCPLEKAREIADSMRRSIREFRFVWKGKLFEVGVSIGLVPISEANQTAADVLSAADSACYVAKDHGRNRLHVYQPDDQLLAQRHGEMQWVSRIAHAFEEQRFEIHYQPIMALAEGRANGRFCEVLIRMRDEQGQLVRPKIFLPAAERYSLMPSLDRWVIRTTLQALRDPQHAIAADDYRCAVNLSGQSLSDGHFLDFVVDELERTGVEATRLCFEITETAAIANLASAHRFMAVLRGMGCHFSLDDFGSGLSSFAYLKNLPVDYLKIAGSFVRNILVDSVDRSLVESINQVGRVMSIATIAESVENGETLALVRKMGIDYAQGYAIAKPAAV